MLFRTRPRFHTFATGQARKRLINFFALTTLGSYSTLTSEFNRRTQSGEHSGTVLVINIRLMSNLSPPPDANPWPACGAAN